MIRGILNGLLGAIWKFALVIVIITVTIMILGSIVL